MEQYSEFNLAGFHHFANKDRTKIFYIVQISTNVEEGASQKKCILINVFVDKDTYAQVIAKEIGETLNVKITSNLETGKLRYEIVL